MKLLRYRQKTDKPARWGWLSDEKIGNLEGSPFDTYRRKEPRLRLENVQLLPPAEPSKIVCIGRNYAAHAAEHGAEVPELPLIFLKPPSALIAHGQTIFLPPQSRQVEHEAELAVVIGESARRVTPESASRHILGYTIANDVTARDLQHSDGQWTRGKGFDTFCPLGPWIETDLDPAALMVSCTVNGQLRQMASTRDLVFRIPNLIAFISAVMTLEPGDLILTGTPSGVGPLLDGDQVEVEIEKIGKLSNPIANLNNE